MIGVSKYMQNPPTPKQTKNLSTYRQTDKLCPVYLRSYLSHAYKQTLLIPHFLGILQMPEHHFTGTFPKHVQSFYLFNCFSRFS